MRQPPNSLQGPRSSYFRLAEIEQASLCQQYPDDAIFRVARVAARIAGQGESSKPDRERALFALRIAQRHRADLGGWGANYRASAAGHTYFLRLCAIGKVVNDPGTISEGESGLADAIQVRCARGPREARDALRKLNQRHQRVLDERAARVSALRPTSPRPTTSRQRLRRVCGGRRRRTVSRSAARSAASSGGSSSGSPSGDDGPAEAAVVTTAQHRFIPPWWLARFGHLPPDQQLQALHRLSERERRAFFSYVAIAAQAPRDANFGVRPIGLGLASYVSDLRRGS